MITYKNITDVEVLEQASENTKVLVNEGGELMQAPYSNFEDKMKDAEVLEEIPENAMALVNDGGELKQVACSGFGGGGSDVVLFAVNRDTGVCTCNTLYEVLRSKIDNFEPFVCAINRYDPETDPILIPAFANRISIEDNYIDLEFFSYQYSAEYNVTYVSDGTITYEEPSEN